jgi:hypothetical protein
MSTFKEQKKNDIFWCRRGPTTTLKQAEEIEGIDEPGVSRKPPFVSYPVDGFISNWQLVLNLRPADVLSYTLSSHNSLHGTV